MKKIIFCDVDGTLLTSNYIITEKSLYAINEIQRQGGKFIIVTARAPVCTYPLLDKYNLKVDILAGNGSYIIDENRNVLYENSIEKEKVAPIIEYIKSTGYDLSISVYSKTEWVAIGNYDKRVEIEENIVDVKAVYGDLKDIKEDKICKVFCIGNKEEISKIENELKIKYPEYNIVKSNDLMLEITKKDSAKDILIKKYAEMKNIDLKECLSFGDSYADIKMLNMVGYGFIMDNAKQELKDMIKYHTVSNDNDGVYYALKKYNLIK